MAAAVRAATRRRGAGRVGDGEGGAVATRVGVVTTARRGVTGGALERLVAGLAPGSSRGGKTLALTLAPEVISMEAARSLRRGGVDRLLIGSGRLTAASGARLRRVRIAVRHAVDEERCGRIHQDVLHHRATGLPGVTLKAAVSLDGMLACEGGHSQWITGPQARREGHRLRARHDGIAVGIGTVLADDPRLNVREVSGHDPRPVIFDGRLRALAGKRMPRCCVAGAVIVHGPGVARARLDRARQQAITTIQVDRGPTGALRLREALRALAEHEVRSLMVEGGGGLLASFVSEGLWQRWWLFTAPRVLGGRAVPLLPGLSWARVDRAPALRVKARRRVGADLLTVLAPGKSADR